jgi:hypothetical protein
MEPDLKIHFWQIKGYVNIDRSLKNKLLEYIKNKTSIHNFSRGLNMSSVTLNCFLNRGDTHMRIQNLIQITKKRGIPLEEIEERIISFRDTNSKKSFNLRFPYSITPVDIRITGAIFGDGNIHKTNNLARWIQKDTTPMASLINIRLGTEIKQSSTAQQITIPAFIIKAVAAYLKITLQDVNKTKFLEACLHLPFEYRLALLLAIIEDEGNIDFKNYGGINIRISSKKGTLLIKQLIESLNYKVSGIKTYFNKGSFENNKMYKLTVPIAGIEKLWYDLLEFEKKYGPQAGLWTKRKPMLLRFKKGASERAKKCKEITDIKNKILLILEKNKIRSPKAISEEIKIATSRAQDIMRRMHNTGQIIRIKKGVYMSKKL